MILGELCNFAGTRSFSSTPMFADSRHVRVSAAYAFVVTPMGVRLCRPSEAVLDILPEPQRGAFAKEDGERVVDADGRRLG